MKHVLVVWNEIPEEVSFMNLTVEEADYEKVIKFHNNFINGSEMDHGISEFFYDSNYELKFPLTKEPITNSSFDAVVITGIIL